jgi:glycosyltransferase involved in cell wall biosynthesis
VTGGRPLEVALLTEGTYPHSYGGVSVWCDQLVRGMPGHHFTVSAIVGNGTEQVAWDLPQNASLVTVPLWGDEGSRRLGRRKRTAGARLFRRLVECLLADPDAPAGSPRAVRPEEFGDILRRLHDLADGASLTEVLSGQDAVAAVMEAWGMRRHDPGFRVLPSVYDAVTVTGLLEHTLRPLFRPAVKADVTHAVTNGLAVLIGLAAKWTYGTPLILTEHGVYLRERYLEYATAGYSWPVKALMLNFMRRLCTEGYRAADLITPGNRYNQRWELRCGAEPENLQTVYNGVDPAHFPPAGPEPALPTITWAGRIDQIKDLETLLRAFALVRKQIPEARLRMFGGGNAAYQARCERLLDGLGLTGAASFEGRVGNILDAYASGHVVALSSISEGFPYTLIEAMTAGRATVSTDVGGVSEAVGDTGVVVPPRDPEAMAAACVQLLRDDTLRRRLGSAARQRALENFTVEQAIGAFDMIYAGVAAGRPVQLAAGELLELAMGRAASWQSGGTGRRTA